MLTPGGPNLDIVAAQTGIAGFTGFIDPLDLVENPANGFIYLSECGASRITLLRPTGLVSVPGDLDSELSFSLSPNPARRPRLSFTLPEAADVDLAVFDISGRRVATLATGTLPAGAVWTRRGGRPAQESTSIASRSGPGTCSFAE